MGQGQEREVISSKISSGVLMETVSLYLRGERTSREWEKCFGGLFNGLPLLSANNDLDYGMKFNGEGDWEDPSTHFYPVVIYSFMGTGKTGPARPSTEFIVRPASWTEENTSVERAIVDFSFQRASFCKFDKWGRPSIIQYSHPLTGKLFDDAWVGTAETFSSDLAWKRIKRIGYQRTVGILDSDWVARQPRDTSKVWQEILELSEFECQVSHRRWPTWTERERAFFIDEKMVLYRQNEKGEMALFAISRIPHPKDGDELRQEDSLASADPKDTPPEAKRRAGRMSLAPEGKVPKIGRTKLPPQVLGRARSIKY